MEKKNQKSKDQQIVVLEDINSKFSLMLEQFSGIRKEIRDNHKEFFEFKTETNANFKEISKFIDRTDRNLKVALEYLFRIDEEIQDLKREVRELKKLLKDKTDFDKLMAFEKRLIKLEKLVMAKLA